MKKYFIKLAALSVAVMMGVCALAACGSTSETPTDEGIDSTENATEQAEDSVE